MEKYSQELFEQLYVPIVSFVEEIIDDYEAAQDIAIEVFRCKVPEIELYEGFEDLSEVIRVLQKEALIQSFIYLRRSKEYQQALETFVESYAAYEISVEEVLIVKEIYQLLQKKTNGLPERQREAMELYFSDLQAAEAAGKMKISESTYRNTKSAAIKKYLKLGTILVIIVLLSIIAKAK